MKRAFEKKGERENFSSWEFSFEKLWNLDLEKNSPMFIIEHSERAESWRLFNTHSKVDGRFTEVARQKIFCSIFPLCFIGWKCAEIFHRSQHDYSASESEKLFSNNSTESGEGGWSYEFDFTRGKVLSRSFGVRNACKHIQDAGDEGELPPKFKYPITRICTGVWRWRQLEGQICELISGVLENFLFHILLTCRECAYIRNSKFIQTLHRISALVFFVDTFFSIPPRCSH